MEVLSWHLSHEHDYFMHAFMLLLVLLVLLSIKITIFLNFFLKKIICILVKVEITCIGTI
jgi:hypothetical protein